VTPTQITSSATIAAPKDPPGAEILQHGILIPDDLPSDSQISTTTQNDDVSLMLKDGIGHDLTLCDGKVIKQSPDLFDDYNRTYGSSLGQDAYASDVASFRGNGASILFNAIKSYAQDCQKLRVLNLTLHGRSAVRLSGSESSSFGTPVYIDDVFVLAGNVVLQIATQSPGGNHALVVDELAGIAVAKLDKFLPR
jgi:hypothetical protein